MAAFATAVDGWRRRIGARLEELPRQLALEAAVRLLERSPVATGRFVANWQVSVAGAAVAFDERLADPEKTLTGERLADAIGRVPPGASIAIVNPSPYGSALEFGTPKRLPTAMVRPTFAELPAALAALAREDVP
jgi:hypothetical protein